jgi:exodeoxyribonuclease III
MNNLKIQSWNINGIRAAIKKGFWEKLIELETDIIGLQEIKCDYDSMKEILGIKAPKTPKAQSQNLLEETEPETKLDYIDYCGFRFFWHSCSVKKGYSGTAVLVRLSLIESGLIKIEEFVTSLGIEEYDCEGRVTGLAIEVNGTKLFLLNCYYPQGGRDGRIPYKIGFYKEINNLCNQWKSRGYELILTGDFNTTVTDIDLARPKENRKTTGCLPEERMALNWLLEGKTFDLSQLISTNLEFQKSSKEVPKLELVDTFRHQNPELIGAYSYWDQITRARDRNVGWRIDMFFVSPNLMTSLIKASIHSQMLGSDHCPIEIEIRF